VIFRASVAVYDASDRRLKVLLMLGHSTSNFILKYHTKRLIIIDKGAAKFSKTLIAPLLHSVSSRFFQPALNALLHCPSTRLCPSLSDSQWIQLGVNRVIDASASGRGFLQSLISQGSQAPSYTHFFETLKSKRRLNLCKELNEHVANTGAKALDDTLAEFDELKKFELRAGAGHWRSHASHDAAKISSIKEDGTQVIKKYPVGHLYSLDLRTHLMRHLTTADQIERRKEHDMRGLKRVGVEGLREGVAKGSEIHSLAESPTAKTNLLGTCMRLTNPALHTFMSHLFGRRSLV
jgi:hypothetical protein